MTCSSCRTWSYMHVRIPSSLRNFSGGPGWRSRRKRFQAVEQSLQAFLLSSVPTSSFISGDIDDQPAMLLMSSWQHRTGPATQKISSSLIAVVAVAFQLDLSRKNLEFPDCSCSPVAFQLGLPPKISSCQIVVGLGTRLGRIQDYDICKRTDKHGQSIYGPSVSLLPEMEKWTSLVTLSICKAMHWVPGPSLHGHWQCWGSELKAKTVSESWRSGDTYLQNLCWPCLGLLLLGQRQALSTQFGSGTPLLK